MVFASPKDESDRTAVARTCLPKLGIKFRAMVDGFDNHTEIACTACPDRIYLIDQHVRVTFKSGPGPFGFKPSDLEVASESVLRIFTSERAGFL